MKYVGLLRAEYESILQKHYGSVLNGVEIHPETLRREDISERLSVSWVSSTECCFVFGE